MISAATIYLIILIQFEISENNEPTFSFENKTITYLNWCFLLTIYSRYANIYPPNKNKILLLKFKLRKFSRRTLLASQFQFLKFVPAAINPSIEFQWTDFDSFPSFFFSSADSNWIKITKYITEALINWNYRKRYLKIRFLLRTPYFQTQRPVIVEQSAGKIQTIRRNLLGEIHQLWMGKSDKKVLTRSLKTKTAPTRPLNFPSVDSLMALLIMLIVFLPSPAAAVVARITMITSNTSYKFHCKLPTVIIKASFRLL